MYGEIITIGNELTSGRTIDMNAWYAAGRLTASGIMVTRITTVGDDPERMSKALTNALKESRFVIITGGLGSTDDDITNKIVADALNRPLCLDEEMYERIQSYVRARGTQMTPYLEKMAWLPEGAKMLNPRGNACGFYLVKNKVHLYFLPGVPDQMRYLMDKFALPEILSLFKTLPVLRQRLLKIYGVNEPKIAEIMKDISQSSENIVLGFYPQLSENHLTISIRGNDEPTVIEQLDKMEYQIRQSLDPFIFAVGTETMEGVIGKRLGERDITLSVAESCTGGLIGNLLTNVPGSSTYFQGGIVVYSNQSKIDLLGVKKRTIDDFGAVSDQTVREMALGIKRKIRSDMGLAVTGIAGPDGGSKDKPVGTVHIGLAVETETFSGKYRFWGSRKQIKLNTAMMALDWVRRYLNGNSFIPCI